MHLLFYSHDGLGLGHIRRHLAIAAAVTRVSPQTRVLLATSVDEVSRFGLPSSVDTLKLPGLRKIGNTEYIARRLGLGGSEIGALRAELLLAAVRTFRPDVLLVDKHPLGVAGELHAALETARRYGARTVLGLRDILDEPASVLQEWSAAGFYELVPEYYDLTLVYGVPSVFDVIAEYRFPPRLAERTKYCGYVVTPSAQNDESQRLSWHRRAGAEACPVVLGTTGGGEDGAELLGVFIGAAAEAPWKGVAVGGPLLSPQITETLRALAAENGVVFQSFIPALAELFHKADGLVCMGGYNTLAEAMATGVPTVCVPRVRPRVEQLLRAEAFQRLGLLRSIHPAHLTPDSLREAITVAQQTPRAQRAEQASCLLDLDGARRAAQYLLGLSVESRPLAERNWAPVAR